MQEKVLVILKPDCLKRKLENQIISSILISGLYAEDAKVLILDGQFLEVMYKGLQLEHFYQDLVNFMRSGPCMAMLVTGTEAVERMNRLKHELRQKHQDFWTDLSEEDLRLWRENRHPNQKVLNLKLVAANLIHVCDSEEESTECAKLLFGA